MESLSVTGLRDLAREAVFSSGARGFVRFAREGGALLVTDAAARCADGGAAMTAALLAAGFSCEREGMLTLLTPGDALLARLCRRMAGEPETDWASPLHPAQSLAVRLMRESELLLTDAGRGFILAAARLCWQPQDKALDGLVQLRAHAALLMRKKDRSGFAPAGRLLANWTDEQMKEESR